MIPPARRLRLWVALLCVFLTVSIAHAQAYKSHQLTAEAHQAGDLARTLDYLRQAHSAQPYDLQIKKDLATVLLTQAHKSLQAAQYPQAERLFLEGQQLVPDDIRFWIGRSHALLSAKDYSSAEVDANEALGIDPQQTDAWQLLGRIYYQTSRLPEAVDAWQQAISFGAESPGLNAMLAKARRELQVEEGMTQSYAASFVLSYDAERKPDLSADLLDVLNQAYVEVGMNLNSYPPGQVPVLIYTRQDFSKITASPDWAVGLFDGKIRIPLGGVKRVSAPLRAILFHEYTHVVVRALAGNRCPTWLNEGMAEQIGRSQFDPPLEHLVNADSLIDFAVLSGSWKKIPAEKVRLAYEQSYSFVNDLVDDYGWHLLEDVLQALAAGKTTDEAFSQAFESYGLTLDDLQRQWRQGLGRP